MSSHEGLPQASAPTAGRHADATPAVPIAVAGPGRWRHDRARDGRPRSPSPFMDRRSVRMLAMRDQMLATQICAQA
jgi:hypothetical protein